MDAAQAVKTIDKFLKDQTIRSKKEVDKKGTIIIKGIGLIPGHDLCDYRESTDVDQLIFSIKKDPCSIDITVNIQKLYLETKVLAEKLHARVFMSGRVVDDYRQLHTVPDMTETIVTPKPQPNIKSEMDPQNIESDERFLEIISQIKNKMQSEMPIMAQEVMEQLGEDCTDEVKEKLKQAVFATATTTSMLTIRFLMEVINEVVGD